MSVLKVEGIVLWIPVWHAEAAVPRSEILRGELTDAELALSLSAVVRGTAKVPYNTAESFFTTTHLTTNLKVILDHVLGRLSQSKRDANPVVVLDVGFGGGKTHTLVALYYAAREGASRTVSRLLTGMPRPRNVRVVGISGEEYGGEGVTREGQRLRTLWGDVFWQLGVYDKFARLDREAIVPELEQLKQALEGGPVLILLDEFPSYLSVARTHDPPMMDKAVQFLQRLVQAVCEKEDAALVVAIAEDVYAMEARRSRKTIIDEAERHFEEARGQLKRKEIVMVPVQEEDVVHILQRRLFESINHETARSIADAYRAFYREYTVPDYLRTSKFRDDIERYYPFHPDLIRVLYERLATLGGFQRTRGALRLLSRVIRRLWQEKEPDALLIHPYHVDLADEEILNDLTVRIGEDRRRNAVEADVWRDGGGAVAQEMDEQSVAHWGAPLVRRACNTIYLWSLAAGREGDRGIPADLLVALTASPARPDQFLRLRDTVLTVLQDRFHYVDRKGERFEFVLEPTPTRVIELASRDVTTEDAIRILREAVDHLFSQGPSWLRVETFPKSPEALGDEPEIKVGILNPTLYTIPTTKSIPEAIGRFLTHQDERGRRLRKFRNDTFLLVVQDDRVEPLLQAARKVHAAREVRQDPTKYGIPKERKRDVEEYETSKEKTLNDFLRTSFVHFLYFDRQEGKVRVSALQAAGYGAGRGGGDVLAHHLVEGILRVRTEPLDPEYIREYAWPGDSPSVSTKGLYERLHATPGLILPADLELFRTSITRGIERGVWVLKAGTKVYDKDSLPTVVPLDEATELWDAQEAARRGIAPGVVEEGEKKERKTREGVPPPVVETVILAEALTSGLAEDLEKRARTGNFDKVLSASLRFMGSPTALVHLRNLLTKLETSKTVEIKLHSTVSRFAGPHYDIEFDLDREGLGTDEAKAILDLAWRLVGCDQFSATLTLSWSEGAKPQAVADLIRSLKGTEREPLKASLEAQLQRGG